MSLPTFGEVFARAHLQDDDDSVDEIVVESVGSVGNAVEAVVGRRHWGCHSRVLLWASVTSLSRMTAMTSPKMLSWGR
jgi:hypothetical protein